MTPYELAMLVLAVAVGIVVQAGVIVLAVHRAREKMDRRLDEVIARLQSAPRYFCDTGNPSQAKRALAAARAVSKNTRHV